MTDIIIRTSDGLVQQVADSIVMGTGYLDDRYIVTQGAAVSYEPINSFGFPVTLLQSVTNVPGGLIPGWNYNYVGGAFVSNGHSPPAPPPRIPASLTSPEFVNLALSINNTGFNKVLANMPSVMVLLSEYTTVAGLNYEDAVNPSSPVGQLMAAAVAAGYISNTDVTNFLAAWVADY